MQDEPVNLSAIDPDRDPDAAARFEAAVMARVHQVANCASETIHPLVGVWSFARTLALAASIVLCVTVGAVVRERQAQPAPAPLTVAEAIGVPPMFLAGRGP